VIRREEGKKEKRKKREKKRLLGYLISRVAKVGKRWYFFFLSFFSCLSACPSFRAPNFIHNKNCKRIRFFLSLFLSSIIHSSGDGDSDKISIGKTHARTHASTRARPHTHTPRDRHSCARTDTDRRIKMDR